MVVGILNPMSQVGYLNQTYKIIQDIKRKHRSIHDDPKVIASNKTCREVQWANILTGVIQGYNEGKLQGILLCSHNYKWTTA